MAVQKGDFVILEIKVKPASSAEGIEVKGEEILVKVKEKAEKGKANLKVVRILEKAFGKKIRIVRGLKNRKKLIMVKGTEEEVKGILKKFNR